MIVLRLSEREGKLSDLESKVNCLFEKCKKILTTRKTILKKYKLTLLWRLTRWRLMQHSSRFHFLKLKQVFNKNKRKENPSFNHLSVNRSSFLFHFVWNKLSASSTKGSHSLRKVQFFWTLFKRPLIPPPFYLNICPILQGVFFHVVNFLNDAPPYTMARMSSPHLKCCINVGFREAPCKKSFGILASYWTPPKIK